jgi:Ni2+-binding GTPase involved in maturation of urease and hydrogenase
VGVAHSPRAANSTHELPPLPPVCLTVVPALVVTGFLGSGKTTLLQHLLATTQLHLGVLVNEAAAIDIDGQLLSTQRTNAAAAGVTPAATRELAGGCACCSASSDLQAALQQLASSSSYAALDYLLLETSGVSDAGALADLLAGCGFRLHGVVAVLDAEAGTQQLQQHAVALAQVRVRVVVGPGHAAGVDAHPTHTHLSAAACPLLPHAPAPSDSCVRVTWWSLTSVTLLPWHQFPLWKTWSEL